MKPMLGARKAKLPELSTANPSRREVRTIQDASARYETALRNSWVKWVVRRADNASLALWLSQLASGGKTLAYKLSAACSGYNAYITRIKQRALDLWSPITVWAKQLASVADRST